ncbi:MAG: geranylgeranyl reductase family protein [Bacillota bacterium]
MHQVIIVGAGPAGAYLAYLLAREGIDVLLLEKEYLPRNKLCGGGISPKVIKLLDFDLNPVIENTIYKMIITHRLGKPINVNSDQPIVYMSSRDQLDNYLVNKAKHAGATVLDGLRVKKVQSVGKEVFVYTNEKVFSGSILIGADGANSIVARSFGLAKNRINTVAFESHVPLSQEKTDESRCTIRVDYGLVPKGYAWVFPKSNYLSVGVGSTSPKIKGLDSYLNKWIRAENFDVPALPQKKGWVIPLNPQPNDLHNNNVIVIGDAGGLVDPVTGEGIYAAIYSACLAAQVITEQVRQARPDLQRYTNLILEKIKPEITNAFRFAGWFYLASNLFHRFLGSHQETATGMMQVISGNLTYAQFFATLRPKM